MNFHGPERMKLMPDSGGEIDVRHWYKGKLGEHFTYALRAAFADQPPDIHLPITWDFGEAENRNDGHGGDIPNDPLMLYVSLPLGADDGNGNEVIYGLSLEAVVDELIDGHTAGDSNKIVDDEEQRSILVRVAARLRELADKIDTALAAADA
jgi:hypothetical protein